MTREGRGRRKFRSAWVMAGIFTVLLGVMLVISGLASAGIVSDNLAHDPTGDQTVPTSVLEGGAVVDATRTPVTSKTLPPRTIALTFDDGPDPTWTPQVLSILRKHNVAGTFFVVGSRATSHPDLIRAIHDSGSELAHHTFTHPDLVEVSTWRMDRELDQTQLALSGAADVTGNLFRPPFSSSASSIDDLGYRTVLSAGQRGYVSVFTDYDSEDWERPGVDAIVRNATPPEGEGGTVLLHDSGGDRSQTVAALDKLIPKLRSEGYRFTTVSEGAGLGANNQQAAPGDHLLGSVLLAIVGVSLAVVDGLQWILLLVGLLVIARLVLMVVVAGGHVRRRRAPGWSWGVPVTAPVSVIVPAYNEKANIEVAIRSILAGDHPIEVLVVDDGSTDGTADLVESLCLPRVRVIRKVNGGKASALNTGIAHARYDLIVMVDGDTVFERDTVRHLVQPFGDPGVGAVAGNVKIANRDTFLTRLQHIEYVVGFNVDRRVHDVTGSMPTIPGAAGAFRREALTGVGGVSEETLAEDTDLTIAIGRAGWRMVFEEKAVAWTEAPTSLHQLWQQRFRWTYGTMQAIWKHRRAIVQRGAAGRIGRFGLLHVIAFQVLLPVSAPLIDIFFVYGLFFLDPGTTLVLWLLVIGIQTGGALFAFRVDGEQTGPLWLMPAQQLVYRQLMYVVLGQSLVAAVSGIRVKWQRMRRTGALEVMVRSATPDPAAATAGGPVAVPRPTTEPRRRPGMAATRTPATPRNRWFDVLGATALCWIVLADVAGWAWLSAAQFVPVAVLFALGGSLMVKSLRHTPAVDVIGYRLRRILPPLWVFGLALVPMMLVAGWTLGGPDSGETSWTRLLLWVLPAVDPPSSPWAADSTGIVWLLRASFWFILLTPLLLKAFRRRPLLTLLAPLLLVAADAAAGAWLDDAGPAGIALLDFGTFGTCWLLGIAHGEGLPARLRPVVVFGLAAGTVTLVAAWAFETVAVRRGFFVDDIPLAQALLGAATVLVSLRLAPRLHGLGALPGFDRLVAGVNARAVTILLWHGFAVKLAGRAAHDLGWSSDLAPAGLAVGFLVLALLAFGWVEDFAARRPVRLLPAGPPGAAGEPATSRPGRPAAATAGGNSTNTSTVPQ